MGFLLTVVLLSGVAASDGTATVGRHVASLSRPVSFAPSGWTVTRLGDLVLARDDGSNGCDGEPTDLWFQTCWYGAMDAYLAAYPEADPDFLVTYTAWETNAPYWFYAAFANDVRGLGYRHFGTEIFSTPGVPHGVLFMNSLGSFDWGPGGAATRETTFRAIWSQEIAHRWGTRVHYVDRSDGADREDDLDSYRGHWSEYFDSDSSCMGGHEWKEESQGRFRTDNLTLDGCTYSTLDLYLNGFVPPSAVSEGFVIRDPVHQSASTVTGMRVRVSVDDVIAAEGPRDPDWLHAQRRFLVHHLVILRASDSPDAQTGFLELLDWGGDEFRHNTRGLARLETSLDGLAPIAPPDVSFTSPDSIAAREAARFDASASSPASGGALSFVWDFGDGTGDLDSGATPAHRFAEPGDYLVTVLAADGHGVSASASRVVHVASAPGCACAVVPRSRTSSGTVAAALAIALAGALFFRRSCTAWCRQ